MLSRILRITCFLICFGAILPVSVYAQSRIVSPSKALVEAQEDDNKNWEKEATARESELVKVADAYYKGKDYRKAADYYKRVVDLRYKQWDFPETKGSIRPAHDTKSVKLNTSSTRRARDRLETIGDQIDAVETKATQSELKALFEQADLEIILGNVVEAYSIYGKIGELASRVGKEKYAIDAANKAKAAQANILKQTDKSFGEIQKLIVAGKIEDAAKSMDVFIAKNRVIISLSPELAAKLQKLQQSPAFTELEQQKKSEQRIEMGDAAFARGNYVSARRYYREVFEKHPETEAARNAEVKLTLIMSDPEIQAALAKQEADGKCAPLIARARTLAKLGRSVEAVMIAEKIISDYPGSTWAVMANELLESIESAELDDARKPDEAIETDESDDIAAPVKN